MPNGDGAFIVAHGDGNFYVYEKASREYRETIVRLFLNSIRSDLNRCISYYNVLFFFPFQNKEGSGDPLFPVIKDQTQFSVAHARYSKVY